MFNIWEILADPFNSWDHCKNILWLYFFCIFYLFSIFLNVIHVIITKIIQLQFS